MAELECQPICKCKVTTLHCLWQGCYMLLSDCHHSFRMQKLTLRPFSATVLMRVFDPLWVIPLQGEQTTYIKMNGALFRFGLNGA